MLPQMWEDSLHASYLFRAWIFGVAVKLIYDYWVLNVVHCNVLKGDVFCIPAASLLIWMTVNILLNFSNSL